MGEWVFEFYDRFPPTCRKFLEALTANFVGDGLLKAAEVYLEKVKIYEQPRGSSKNVGRELSAVHPVGECKTLALLFK